MNIHLSEILLIIVIALIVIKPQHLPDVAHNIGRWLKGVRQIIEKIKHKMDLS